jgi:CAAX protease family protein
MEENQLLVEKNEAQNYFVPWSATDTWIGVGLLILLSLGMIVLVFFFPDRKYLQSVGVLFLESMYLLPVALIFAWRHISWKYLGFGKFTLNIVGLGCGLLVIGYLLILLHNTLLKIFGVDTQGDQIFQIFGHLQSPVWFFIVGAVIAPFVEEIFFRGFLFQGFRQKYGWLPGLLLSSAIFGAAHLDPVSLIPTFILGCVLAFMYHKSNSLWPGILFHATINSLSLFAIYMISKYPSLFPQ